MKILMMGGRRCGKATALASMLKSMTGGIARKYFTAFDATTNYSEMIVEWLDAKILDLKELLEHGEREKFVADTRPGRLRFEYDLKVGLPDSAVYVDLVFNWVPGEHYHLGGFYDCEVRDLVSKSDVFVIAIDTPYLMGEIEIGPWHCNDAVNRLVNCIDDIHNLLTCIDDHGGENSKMVVFMPIKCEKWFHEGRIDEVNRRVREVYLKHIILLRSFLKMSIAIIPILTAGNLLFSEFSESYELLEDGILPGKRCCRLGDSDVIRFSDGSCRLLRDTDILREDLDSYIRIGDTNVMPRPLSWYCVNPADNTYKPYNCEQVPLHILQFMVRALAESSGGILNIAKRVALNKLDSVLLQMRKDGVIKENCDGISYI